MHVQVEDNDVRHNEQKWERYDISDQEEKKGNKSKRQQHTVWGNNKYSNIMTITVLLKPLRKVSVWKTATGLMNLNLSQEKRSKFC